MAAMALATPRPMSSWVWMPIRATQRLARQAGDRRHVRRQRSAVGVAQRDDVRARLLSGVQRRHRVGRVLLEPVEAVLRVVDDELAVLLQEAHGVGDHPEVLVERRLQHFPDVERRGLAEDRDHRRGGGNQELDLLVGRRGDVLATRRAERCQARVLERAVFRLREELDVLGIRAGPAAFDVVHAERVEPVRDAQLVGHGERDAVALRAVPQGGVVDLDVGCHPRGVPSIRARASRSRRPVSSKLSRCSASSYGSHAIVRPSLAGDSAVARIRKYCTL